MIFQALAPSTEVFAQELDAVMEASVSAARAAGNTARSVQDAVATALQDADQATSDDAATTPGAGAGATEGGNGSTNAGDSQDSTTDGANSGDAPAEGDASQDDATADDGATDEEQTNDADADAAAQANPTIDTVDALRDVLGDNKVTTDDSGTVTAITFGSNADLIAISNTDPAIYQNAIISKGGSTGIDFDVCGAETVGDLGSLTFQGFGSDDHPFKGALDLGDRTLAANKTLFNNIVLSDANSTVKLTWKGTDAQPIVAAKVAGESKTLSATITVDKPDDNNGTSIVKLTSPLVGEVAGMLTLNATYATSANSPLAINMQSSTGNLGLLVDTLAGGASLTIAGLNGLPESFNGIPTIDATGAGANAGGLIGEAGEGAAVTLASNVDVSALSVVGKNAAGGLIGKTNKITLSVGAGNNGKDASGKDINVKPARAVGSSPAGMYEDGHVDYATYAGGLIGDASFAGPFTINSGIFDFGEGVALSVSNTSVSPSAGGLFGVLDISNGDVTVNGGLYKSTLQNGTDNSNNNGVRGNYGGLVGKLWGQKYGEALHAFTVKGGAEVSFGVGPKGNLTYAGGLVGYLGEGGGSDNVSAVVIGDATVTCATSGYASNNGKYGGAVGVVDTKNVLEVRGLKVETAGNATIGGSNGGFAGVVGSSWRGIVKFSGVIDLSDARFAENDHTAQLVYENFNSLIFAAGSGSDVGATAGDITKWQYKRPTTQVKIDDIYSYGQVIRLGSGLSNDLITINDSHQCIFKSNLVKTDGAFVLAGVDDFAKLAITWQTSGYFSAVEDVSDDNFAQIPSTNITLSADINLSGTGLTGLTKDRQPKEQAGVNENNHSFAATLNGNGHTISLAVGEPYGMRGNSEVSATSDGNGKIYRHGRLGLFAAINGATVSDVTIAGSMKFDNQSNVDAGALAGVKVGGDTSLTSVTIDAKIGYESTNKDGYVHVGSIIGGMSGAGSLKIGNRESPSIIYAQIASKVQERGTTCVGGAVGYVAGDCVPSSAGKTVEVDGLTISGSIAINGSLKTYAGGFIGQISQGKVDGSSGVLSSVKQVKITKLDFTNFSLATASSGASNSVGLLGFSWAGAEVTLGDDSVNKNDSSYAISTTSSSVSSAKATEFGGLVYAASGHWVINNYALDLSGVTLSAPNAEKFGMLVCRAGSGVSSAVESLVGLYLENRAPWATAYKVNTNNDAITTQAKVFDEWVADGRKPGQEVDDCAVNGVVSLHTREEKLHMTDADGARNTYENRTAYGSEHQTNGSVRYYYNLDRAVADIKQSNISTNKQDFITTPQELLVWSVSWYAPKALRPYVWRDVDSPLLCWGIGRIGAWSGDIQLDMTGYSYYPIDITGINAVVRCSTIKFCFIDINKKENGNKQNSQPSQHMNMHAGLFSSYSGKNSVTIRDVTLQGSIGSAGGGTGALFTKFLKGNGGTAKVTIDGLTLDGLSVAGAKDSEYAPLLINQMASKTNLTVSGHPKNNNNPAAGYVQGIAVKTGSYAAGEKAATSLFGNIGDEKAEMVTANFQDITVPSSKTDGIFTHASLLESFAYDGTKSGSSASYIFYSEKHKDEDSSFTYCEPTYGAEIDSKGNDSEYEGQQRWYNDKKGYMTDDNLVTDGSITANEDNPQFANKYLPYVYKSKEGSGEHAHDIFHEIKVNQRVSNLLTGCGTYGDPYTLTNASEVVAVANYINGKESAADGWQITVIDDQENLCTRRSDGSKGHELIYEYKRSQGSWVCTTDSSKTLSNDTMHSYIQSAYYSVEPADSNYIELDGNSFKGFGNKDNPFRGVIVGDLKKGCGRATLKVVRKTRTISGLIPYSYGCVVKGLNAEYSDGGSGAAGSNVISYTKSTDGIPISFFGGIFGCILGGDNIIDGVAVNSNGFTVKGGSHLVPIGGYVGAIAGGGVIFRNMSGTSWRAGTKTKFKSAGEGGANFQLYDNPYVGRVIDGYAFSEGKDCAVDNGDANYKINKLVDKGVSCVTATAASGNTAARVTPTSSQGLLVLSAIINSGAASGGVSLAYEGGTYDTKTSYKFGNALYGKARNATYEHVGDPDVAGEDFKRSTADDQTAPGSAADGSNSPYLVKNYADAATGSLCASSGVELQLENIENKPYDMTSYGRGFTGLSGRYVSNACASSKGTNRDCIVPRIACINGNGAPITVGTKDAAYGVDEYTDDDFQVSGVGGLFSTVMFTSTNVEQSVTANDGAQVKDLTFSNCNVSLTYKDANGNIASGPASNDLIGTGLLAGATANYDGNTCGVYRNVQVKNCTVLGAKSVGGLLGSSGCAKQKTDGVTYMVDFDSNFNNDFNKGQNYYTRAPVYLYDCSYTGLSVTGEKYVGGYVGAIASPCGVWTTEAEEVGEKAVGENSTITATGTIPYVGGVLGFANLSNISINTNTNKGTITAVQSSTTVISGVNVLATRPNKNQDMVSMGAGGVVGCARGGVISMSNVRIDAGGNTKNVTIGDNSGTNSIIRNVGGLIGRVTSSGSPNRYWFEDCSVKNVNVAGTNQCSGGLIGYYHSNVNIDCNNIAIEDSTIKGSWSGGLLGAINSGSDVINVTNTKVSNTTFGGTSNGGIAGDGRGQFHLVNVLMDSNTYKSGVKQGVLLGEADTRDNWYSLSAAGVDVKPGDGKTTSDLPPMVYATNAAAVNRKTYIAFGDYNDKLDVLGKGITLYGADDTATTAASPYVTTSPVSTLAVRASNGDTTDRYLFGDGAAINTAATIQSQVNQSKAGTSFPGRYTYTNIGGINDAGAYQNTSTYSADSSRSTYNANNITSGKKAKTDFPVLVIPGNDTTTVESYLNIVTNGGFSDARRLNGSTAHVTATAEVFSLADNGTFVKDAAASQAPTLKVLNNGTSSMAFRASTDWDNERGRFTLLTVTFSEAGQSYRVQVPIIVKRMLEIDFTATYSEGANFKAADYATKYDKHVLVSSGDTMTGYLTWTYGSARGKPVDYGWNTLLEAGGSMGPLNKSITFGATLPEGTQLTLVDTANNSREYHYTVGTGGATSVKLTEFVDAGNKAYYTEPWLSETVDVKADEAKEDKNGAWVKLADDEVKDKSQAELAKMAGAKVDGAYYRARTSSDATGTFYTLSVDKEEPKSENFYLVVRTPAGSAGVNGYTATTVDTSLNEHINYLLRGKTAADGKAAEDGHQNTPSTYSVASNYTHNLVDNNTLGIKQMELKGATYPLSMNVSDTVTFDPNQQYTSTDALYYQLDSSLVTYHDGAIAGSVGYPTGTQGSYAFYVEVGKNYYTWNGSGWAPAGATETPVVSGLTWKSKGGGDMSLVLADANGNSIDMSGLREIAKNHDNAFTVTMKAALTMSEPACQAGIVASQNSGTDRYTKPNYRAHLSTHVDTLSISSNSAYTDGNAGYYRMDVGSSTIALEASKKSQLGINIDDLKSADGTIALVGTYDLSKLSGGDSKIKAADTVTYTLSLQRKDDGKYVAVDDISKYITVLDSDKLDKDKVSLSGGSYVFTDTKAGDTFATRDGSTLAFKHAFRVKVNTDVETAGQTYANYRLVLTAHMSGGGVNDTPVNVSNLDGYTNSDYVTYTLARINTQGIPHGTN